MASPASHSVTANDVDYPFPRKAALKPQPPAAGTSRAARIAAMSVEFVAKPQEARRVEASIPAAIDGALKGVTGFAGCLVMISDQEARLVTVVTLWVGEDRMKHCRQNARWVDALLAPYLDRHLRVQTMVAHLPALAMIRPEAMDVSVCSTMPDRLSEEEIICVG